MDEFYQDKMNLKYQSIISQINKEVMRTGCYVRGAEPNDLASIFINDVARIIMSRRATSIDLYPGLRIGGLSIRYYEHDFVLKFEFVSDTELANIYQEELPKFDEMINIMSRSWLFESIYNMTYYWFKHAVLTTITHVNDDFSEIPCCQSCKISCSNLSSGMPWDVNGYLVQIESLAALKVIANPRFDMQSDPTEIKSLCVWDKFDTQGLRE